MRRSRSCLAARLATIAPLGPVLDVGSGDGTLLAAVRRSGRDATGVERKAGEGVLDLDIGEVEGSWGAVVFWHSLEHLAEPARALQRATELLAPGGVLVIAVPNAESLQCRLFGRHWLALDPPRHLVHLGSAILRRRLTELGLQIEQVSYLRGGQVVFGWLDGLVGLLPGHPSLYDAIRRPDARFVPVSPSRRLLTLGAGVALLPVALVGAATEVTLRRGGTVYVEARAAG